MLDNIFFRISLRPQAKWAGWPLTKSRLVGRRSKIMLREDVDPAVGYRNEARGRTESLWDGLHQIKGVLGCQKEHANQIF